MRILFLLSLLYLGSCNTPTEKLGGKPSNEALNYVVILTDDLGWNDLSCYGNDFIETPNLDRLAKSGVRFTNGYAAAPLCSASRASMMTGKHPVTVNITEHIHGNQPVGPNRLLETPFIDQQLSLKHTTIAERLKAINYTTGFIGKWHLGGGKHAPQHRGFDVNIAGGYDGLPLTFYYPYFKEGSKPELQIPENKDKYLTDVLTDHALTFVDTTSTPFLLYLAYYSPHVPIEGKAEDVAYYRNKRIKNKQDTSALPNIHYAAMVHAIDQNVGRLLDWLDEKNLTNNTAVIFTSDNGGLHVPSIPGFDKHTPPMSNEPLREGKGYVFEGGNRVPVIVRYPNGKKETVSNTSIVCSDIFTTILQSAGITDSLGRGSSWLPLVKGAGSYPNDRSIVWHNPHYNHQGHTPGSAIVQGDWKLIHDYESNESMLFNLKNDISEKVNLASTRTEVKDKLKKDLDDQLIELGAKMPTPNPRYQSK